MCDSGLDATSVAADGTLTPVPFVADPDAPIDCFYVYPTISRDPGANSDFEAADGEERFATANQAAPLGTACRVFAPVYRQVTLTALAASLAGETTTAPAGPSPRDIAYGDVVDAWNYYLEHDNGGRGVILVGHSQGAGVLDRLIREEIDPNSTERDLLVAAYLAGTSVQVPYGQDVGADFQNVPLCRADDQVGCVVTWSSFRSTSPPPPTSFFGRGRDGTEAGCTNPAALSGGSAELLSRLPANADASILSDLGTTTEAAAWVDPTVGTIDTPYVELPGLVSAKCVEWNGFNWLEITVQGDPADPRADDIPGDLTPEWGLHLVDMNLVMGNLQQLAADEAAAYVAAH